MTALLQSADRRQHCGIRAVQPPLVPAHAVKAVAEIECAIPLVGTQGAHALKFAIEQRLVMCQLVMIDLQHIHAQNRRLAWWGLRRRFGTLLLDDASLMDFAIFVPLQPDLHLSPLIAKPIDPDQNRITERHGY